MLLVGFEVMAQSPTPTPIPLSESLPHVPVASAFTGGESFVIVQSGTGKQVPCSLVEGVLQPFDSDLTSLAAASGIGVLYYRQTTGVWAPVTVGSGLNFSGGTLTAIGGGGSGAPVWGLITGTLSDQVDLQAALDGKQLLDTDLTNIAALSTTSFGRGLLILNNATALRSLAGLEIGVDVQAWDADLDALAAGGVTAPGVSFSNANYTATNVAGAFSELASVNALGPNTSNGKVNWTQLVNVPSGFADGTDDGTGGGGGAGTMNTVKKAGVQVGGADIVTLDFAGAEFDVVEGPDTEVNVTLVDGGIGFAKLQNIAMSRLVGRDSSGTGSPGELTVGGGVEFTGSGGIRTSALTGDVAKAAGGTTTTINNDAVTFAKLQNVNTDRLLGRDTAAAGDAEELTVGGGLEFTGAGGIQVANDGVTFARLQNVTDNRLLGRSAGSNGDTQEIQVGTGLSLSGGTLASTVASGAPTSAPYLLATATPNASLPSAVLAGATPGGELGGSWASPTLDDGVSVTGWDLGASAATTPGAGDNDTSVATTAFVQGAISTSGVAAAPMTFTNKTFNVLDSSSGNSIRRWASLWFRTPHRVSTGGGNQIGNDAGQPGFDCAVLQGANDQAVNYAEYRSLVPYDMDTTVDPWIRFALYLSASDTGGTRFILTVRGVSTSEPWGGNTFSLPITIDIPGDPNGLTEDARFTGWHELIGWKDAMTPDEAFIIRLARDGDAAQDNSTQGRYVISVEMLYVARSP